MHCYCSICRKLQGGSGSNINIMAVAESLHIIQGEQSIKNYVALPETRGPAKLDHDVDGSDDNGNDDETTKAKEGSQSQRSAKQRMVVTRKAGYDRKFCVTCGSYLWGFDSDYAANIYPFASAIDTDLPVPEVTYHIKLNSTTQWADPRNPVYRRTNKATQCFFDDYPDSAIVDWHKKHGHYVD
ncbi:hypothetical protein IWQ60_005555 [Tieghemiomyces parasiticus]|uniref:CENP-V/GFA domain-containing protein n=1 Tax=Tieghemiomyces parasiticus TaxID=78921 RepID=A0A9W8DUI4_9FUNG|nr:hypothetical protein IWQ60_005555 [Tieghemiomyces parasiticus]